MLQTNLEQLEHVDLIRRAPIAPELEYLFKHGLVQETTYEALLKQDRKRLHRFVAETLERDAPNVAEENPLLLAQHWDEAGEGQRAFDWYVRAADRFAGLYANTEALMAYARAVGLANTLELSHEALLHLYTRRGRTLELNAQDDEALTTYVEMERVAREKQDRALELAAMLAELPIYATPSLFFDYARAAALAQDAISLAEELHDRAAQAQALWLRMLLNTRSNHPQHASPDGEAALQIARELNLRELTAFILNDLGGVYVFNSQFERGIALIREATGLWREVGNLPLLANNLSSAANFLLFVGELDEVFRLSDEAYQITEKIGNLWGQSYSLFSVGLAYIERGQFAVGMAKMRECIELGDRAGFVAPHLDTQLDLARAYLWLGATKEAREIAERTVKEVEPFPMGMPLAYATLAEFQGLAGEFAEAEKSLQQARDLLQQESSTPVYEMFVARAEVVTADKRNEFERVLERLEKLMQVMQAYDVRLFLPDALYYRAHALVGLGEADKALEAITEADEIGKGLGSRRLRWKILALRARLERQRGHAESAAAMEAEALEIVEYIAEHAPAELREVFLGQEDVREVMAGARGN